MAKFRLITKSESEDCYRALIIHGKSAKAAREQSKDLLSEGEALVAIDVYANKAWVNVLGTALKGVNLQRHAITAVDEAFEGDAINRDGTQGAGIHEGSVPDFEEKTKLAYAPPSEGFGEALLLALGQAFIVCLVRVFTIPWTIWKGAVIRLAEEQKSKSTEGPTANTEFPMFEWFKSSFDGLIFLSWPLGILGSLYAGSEAYRDGGWVFMLGLLWTYFGVIALSLFKEMLILMLSIALNVEKINHKTPTSQSRS